MPLDDVSVCFCALNDCFLTIYCRLNNFESELCRLYYICFIIKLSCSIEAKIVRALFDYDPQTDEDLAFKKGDRMILIGDW